MYMNRSVNQSRARAWNLHQNLLVEPIGHLPVEDQPNSMNRVCCECNDLGLVAGISMISVRLKL